MLTLPIRAFPQTFAFPQTLHPSFSSGSPPKERAPLCVPTDKDVCVPTDIQTEPDVYDIDDLKGEGKEGILFQSFNLRAAIHLHSN